MKVKYGSAEPKDWAVVCGKKIIGRMLTRSEADRLRREVIAGGRRANITKDFFIRG